MEQYERERAISCLKLAIELAGDGGMTPFSDKEYELMTKFLEEIDAPLFTKEYNEGIICVDEDNHEEFFTHDYIDYKKIVGKCFINERIGIAVKILEVSDDFEPYEFIYERFDKWSDGWVPEDYIWLQDQTKENYEKLKLTPYANMNIASEDMFKLGKNGKLYTSVACDGDYYVFHEITVDEFEKIRNEAIENT